jgi:hypothetical protein
MVITEVRCREGETVVGGGVLTVPAAGVAVVDSGPNSTERPTGWKVRSVNASEPTGEGGSLRAYVICAR